MRRIDYLVLHCSATREGQELPPEALERAHRLRGFNGTGYHYYIRRDGTTVGTRPLKLVGAHVKGYNKYSIGICYEGGAGCSGACLRHAYCAAAHGSAGTGGTAAAPLSPGSRLWSSRPQCRPERQRPGGAARMAEAVSLLRRGHPTVITRYSGKITRM